MLRYPFIMISPDHHTSISPPPSPPLRPSSPQLLTCPQAIPPSHVPSTQLPFTVASPPPLESPDPYPQIPKIPLDVYVDDDTLTSVEKIYLFCRSKSIPHRVFISRSLHTFLPGVSPLEAVEYVLPLLSTLALDDDDAVKEALVTNLASIMWWFFQNCQLVEEEPQEEPQDPPLLPVQTFTPILGSLLIDPNAMVAAPARFAVVDILNRLHAAEETGQNRPPFATQERRMLEQEIVHQVIIGMGRLDAIEEPSPHSSPALTANPSQTSSLPSAVPLSSPIENCLSTFSPSSPRPQPTSSPPLQDTVRPSIQVESPGTTALFPDNLSLAPDSPLGADFPSQEHQSQPTCSSPSLQNTDEIFVSWIPPSPHPTSEARSGDVVEDQCFASDGWLTAEGHSIQDGQDDANEQAAIGRLSSMSLIATVTANATLPEETTRAFAEEVVYIGGDSLYWVRREASFAVGALAKVVPTEVVLLCLLPLFEALAHDTVWHVRHSAVFALPGILTRLTPRHRRTLALDTLISLANDVAPTVRSGVLEVLGEVIYTFHDDEGGAPEELVGMFVGREEGTEWGQHGDATERRLSNLRAPKAQNPLGTLSSAFDSDEDVPGTKDEVPQAEQVGGPSPADLTTSGGFFRDPARGLITSFNYPAVALSLGPRRWREVRAYYHSLTRDGNLHVRRTIAAGLGEMARILGSEIAARDLVDVWQDMVHDAEDSETRLKALGGVVLFVGTLEGETRGGIVKDFVELWERWLTGWRERECLARALPRLAGLADGQGGVIRTLVGKALVDTVAAVREAAIGVVSPVLCAFERRPHLAEALRDDLQGLACADLCRRRVTYIACYRELVESGDGQEIAGDQFWDHVVQLSEDRIVDVRIGVARLLGVICDKFYSEPSSRPARLAETVRRLGQDSSRDVRAFVAYLLMPAGSPLYDSHAIPGPAASPVMFATFSRPPPKTPPLGAMVEAMRDLDVEDDHNMDLVMQSDRIPASWPCYPGIQGSSYSATDSRAVCDEKEDQEQGKNGDPAKSPRLPSHDWEPS